MRTTSIFLKRLFILGDLNHDTGDHTEEHINLHHSLKDVHDSALKAVKDIGGYIHQELSAVAKKHFNTISRPLVRLMAPVLYFKDQLDTLTGVNKPTHDQDISAWCPTCVHDQSDLDPGNLDSIVPDESIYGNIDITTPNPVELSSPTTQELRPLPAVNEIETPQNPAVSDEPDIVLPNDLVHQTKLVQKPENGKDVTGISEVKSEIDIRLGNENSSKQQKQ